MSTVAEKVMENKIMDSEEVEHVEYTKAINSFNITNLHDIKSLNDVCHYC